MKIGETHFYCIFCGKLYSKEELEGRHTEYEMNMLKIAEDISKAFQETANSRR